MKFFSFLAFSAGVASVASRPLTLSKRGVDPNLVPPFGHASGLNPTGTGDCDGIPNAQGVPIKIPCACPPDRNSFIAELNANLAAGHVVNNPSVPLSFPTDNSKASQLARINAAAVTLQNLHGPGVGCPIVSTTFSAQAQAIQNGQSAPAATTPPPASASITSKAATTTSRPASTVSKSKSVAPAPSSSAASVPSAGGVDPNLVPQFGLAAGLNPTGTGDCDGIPNAQGVPIKIPCGCPPDRNSFIASLNANLAAGHVVNNPSVPLSFPTDNSKASQLARINAAAVTLQNLHGPGVGCPIVSTTFSAQAQAIQNGQSAPAATTPLPASASITSKAATTTPKPAATTSKPATTPKSATTAPSSSVAPAPSAGGVDPNLVPQFGLASGLNPTGTGDCDGIPNAQGVPIKIPCGCPPDRNSFIASLNANLAAGHVVNNPSVPLTFPTDNSKGSQLARINAAAVTLQNLHGPGVGCPIVSTTFSAQAQAIQNGQSVPVAAPSPSPARTTVKPATLSASAAPKSSAPAPKSTTTAPAPAASSVKSVDPSLVPQFGHAAGLNPTGTGDCDGIPNAQGVPIKIPCACPPDRNSFIQSLSANVAAGHAVNNPSVKVTFPTDNSKASQLARINAAAITLQNLHGPGVGCPVVSTTFSAQAQAIQNGQSAPSAAPSPAPAAPKSSVVAPVAKASASAAKPSAAPAKPTATAAAASAAGGVDPNLVPQFGHAAGLNPTGTGDCDGIPNAQGVPIKIPCACPPDRTSFIQSLSANVAAGHAVNNPSVKLTFPTDDSKASKLARINAAAITLQNLHGPGVGCPVVSTTFSAQAQAIQNGP